MSGEQEPLELARRLTREAGLPAPKSLERLAGGKNNRVFRLDLADGGSVALKLYFHDPRDDRDRLHAEWSFLTYAWERGVRVIPEPLASARDVHAGLYSFLPGRKLEIGEPNSEHVAATAEFIAATNSAPRALQALPPGSEACFSLSDHVSRIDKRVARLATLAADAPFRSDAEALISGELKAKWAGARARIVAGAADLEAPFPDAEIIASPSDLGFHNALLDEAGRLRFFDFEYAGRDDPAKLAGDFFCCPEIPTPQGEFESFIDGVADRLGLGAAVSARARLLRDAYRIKWTCIILNDFLPVDDARRAFAESLEREERCARQLVKARTKLAEIN